MHRWLSRIAPIYPGEGAVVSLSLAVNLLIVAGIMFGRNARDSLFLIYFGVEYLPLMYFVNAIFLVLCSVVYTTLVDRVERGKFLGAISLVFVACLIASRLALPRPPHHWFYPVLYIEAQVIWYFSLMQFWTFVGDLFDTRQAKRLFPFLAVGALVGMIGVGVGSKAIVHTLGTENLLWVWAALILAGAALGAVAFRRYRLVKEPEQTDAAAAQPQIRPSEWQKIKAGFREVVHEPLERALAGYVLLLWTVYAVVDFCFNKTMRAKYPDPTELTTFFGRFVGAQGLLCLIVQLLLTRAVISRLGLGTTINFHPAFLIAGTSWMSIRYGFSSVLTTKLGDATMLYTFSDSSYQLLYNPISPDRRARVRGFVEGYIRPLSLAAAGGLVLLANSYLKPLHWWGTQIPTGQQLSWGAVILALVWLSFALTSKKGYIHALLRNLQGQSASLRQAAAAALAKLKDPASQAILAQTLHGDDPARVVAAIQFLQSSRGEGVAEAIATLLVHSNPRVRATAAVALGRMGDPQLVEHLTPLLQDPDARVRANTVEALQVSKDPTLVAKLQPLLRDSSARARVNTMLTLYALEGSQAVAEGMPFLEQLAHGDNLERSTATYALGRLPLDQSVDLLAELLKDPEISIRCEAAQALGPVGSPRVIPPLVEALAGPADLRHYTRRSIVAILNRSGVETFESFVRNVAAADRPEIRSELADVLGRLKDLRVVDTLLSLLKDPEWRVRWKVLKAFERLGRQGPISEKARAALVEYAHQELSAFRRSLACTQALGSTRDGDALQMLSRALEEDRLKIEERVFHVLGILCGRDQMLAIFRKLNSGESRMRADALEALDNLAPKEIGREILALLETAPFLAASPSSVGSPLVELAGHPKPWIRACTAYLLAYHSPAAREDLLKGLLRDRDPHVRETALYSGWLAFRDAWQPDLKAAEASDDPLLRRCAQRILATEVGENPDAVKGGRNSMLLTVEKVLFLKSAPVFAGLDGEELAALADIALEKEYQAGEAIFEEKQVAHHLYLIVRGKVQAFHRRDSAEHPVAFLGEKECFGEMAILDDESRSASIRAVEPTLVLKIDRESFRELISERPNISFAIFKILCTRLRFKNLEMESLQTLDAGRHYA